MQWETEILSESGVTVLRPRDSVLDDGRPVDLDRVRGHCRELARLGSPGFLLDLSEVEFVDSRGLSVLVLCLMAFTREGARFAVFGANPLVSRLICLTRLDTVLPIYTSLAVALEAAPHDWVAQSS